MLTRTISTLTTKLSLFVGTSIALVAGGVATFVGNTTTLPIAPQTQAPIKFQTNSKAIRFSDAITLGADSLEQSSARGLTLATADFDEDGTPDLLSGAINAGVGFVSFYRGNVEAIYPQKMAQRVAEKALPFLPANRSVNLPAAPDFMVAGDFNADGHQDVLTAARNGSALYLLAGDGKGGFSEAATMELSGAITALTAGEINRVDGLADVAVAINEREGAKVVLFAAANGAWNAQQQSFGLARSATSLEFAHLTRDGLSDLAIAAGNELIVLEGTQQTPRMTRTRLTFAADSLAVGRFTDSVHEQIAMLANDGSISVASYERVEQPVAQRSRQSNRARANNGWQVSQYHSSDAMRSESVGSRQLIQTKVSAGKHDDLLTLQGNQMRFVTNQDAPQSATATLESEGEVIAALPMRMNANALQGLVMLRSNSATPMAVEPRPEAVFSVNSTIDAGDDNPGDGICRVSTTAPICTLRAAIMEANATAGLDTITFSVGGAFNSGLPLPPITNPIVLDALTSPPPAPVRINSAGQVTFGNILELTGSGHTIRGITFGPATSGFTSISLNSSNDNFIEGCTIQGGGSGIALRNSSRNTIGGTTTIARNVIGGSFGAGVFITDTTSTGNRVLGNYIGLDPTGVRGNGNGVGVVIDLAVNNTIGGTTAAARNVISGNSGEGIEVNGNTLLALLTEAADGNVIQGNYIGVDAAGTGALGNGIGTSIVFPGITIDGASNTTIGGTATGAGNVIANNGDEGVSILPQGMFIGAQLPLNNAVLGNSIYNNGTLGIDLDAFGVSTNDPGDGDGGANTLQNFPILTSALTRTTGTTITGTLNSTASSTFTIEVFSNAACDTSGNGEGETFVARATVTTNAAGVANFSIATTQITAGRFVTATATNASNNTSEFSACQLVRNAVADLIVTQTATPNPVLVGNNLAYNVTVTNSGPDDATGVALMNNIVIPGGQFTLVSVTPSQGTCTGTGPINCNLGTILSNANATVRILIAPTIPTTPPTSGTVPNSVTATNTATVSSNEQDSNTANNINATNATVNASADLAITQTVNITGTPITTLVVTYTITITNNGPSTANNVSAQFDPPPILGNMTCTAPAGWSCNRDGNPFFVFASNQPPGAAVFTLSGSIGCLPQATLITNSVSVSSSTVDVNTTNNSAVLSTVLPVGPPTGAIAYDAPNTTALQFGPVIAGSTGTPPSGTFTVRNLGCVPINLSTAQFVRAGTTSNLAGTDDSRYFSLRLIQSGTEIPLNPTPNPDRNAAQPIPISRTIPAGQSLQFRVVFNPPLPFFAGTFAQRDQGVFASQVLPDSFASSLVIGSNATSNLTANITARVSPLAQIIPRDGNSVGNSSTPLVFMEALRGDFRIRVSMYDANKNITRITYQFFDTFRQPASNPIAVDLTSLISASPLLPGQNFTLQQDFSGAAGRPDIVYVRVTVNDGDGANISATSSPFLPALASPTATFTEGITSEAFRSDVITLPALRLDGGTGNRQTEPRQETKARREN